MNFSSAPRIAASIQISYFDPATKQQIVLGGLAHITSSENDEVWDGLHAFEGHSDFSADKLDSTRRSVARLSLSAETCQDLLRRPIETLLASGRARHASRIALQSALA